jgi:hypothetical protein
VTSEDHADEVDQRWGNTDAYRQSRERTARYTEEDFTLAKKQADAAVMLFVEAMAAGFPADSPQAAHAAEAHRSAISDWWYECSYDMHSRLAQMYLADPRFTATYEDIRSGLARYVHDAILANAISRS